MIEPRATHQASSPRLLEVTDLQTSFFSGRGEVKAVDHVSFTIDARETLGVVGESGCGKSATGLSIARLLPAGVARTVGGSVRLDGRELLSLPEPAMRDVRGAQIGMIFQDPMTSLNPVMSIERQIGEALVRHLRLTSRQARARVIELLDLVGIPSAQTRLHQYPHQFSGGQRQRIVIAMALSCNPKLLIADEPTTALDVTIQAQILDLLRNLQSEFDSGIMLITHSMGVVAGMADRVQVMYAGSIVETGTTEAIFAAPRHPYTVGLMQSLPRLDARERQPLRPIPGLPPDLVDLPDACPFAPRCTYAQEKCWRARPPLIEVADGHSSACWFWDEVGLDDAPRVAAAAAP